MVKIILILLGFPLLVLPVIAQDDGHARLDSLIGQLPLVKPDTNKVKILVEIGEIYWWQSHNQEALRHGFEANELSAELQWRKGVGHSNHLIGSVYWALAEHPLAVVRFYKAIDALLPVRDPVVISCLNRLGLTYREMKMFDKAAAAFQQSIDLAARYGRRDKAFSAMMNMANLYDDRREFEKMADVTRTTMSLAREYDRWDIIAQCYSRLGQMLLRQDRHVEALANLKRAHQIVDSLGLSNRIWELKLVSTAEAYASIRAEGLEEIPDTLRSKRYRLKQARLKLDQARAALHHGVHPTYVASIHEVSAKIKEQEGDLQGALHDIKRAHRIKDSLQAAGHSEEFRLLVKHREEQETRQKEELEAMQQVSKEHERYMLTAGVLILLLMLFIMLGQMVRTRKEKKRSDELLGNILPLHTANELKATGTTEARHYDHVTVLFTDFKDYTRVVGVLSARETVKLIDHYFRAFDRIVRQHGVEKIKTIGDAYMCVGGIPDERPDHALRAVRAAKEMLAFVKAEQAGRSAAGEPWFEIRIGLHTGPVVAGVVGESKFAYDVWGDTVNVAARLEQHGEAGHVNISRTTFEYVKHRFQCSSRGFITVKHGVELELYQVEEVGELVV